MASRECHAHEAVHEHVKYNTPGFGFVISCRNDTVLGMLVTSLCFFTLIKVWDMGGVSVAMTDG